MTEYLSRSATETEEIGARLSEALLDRRFTFVAMYGEMGVGKTAFIRGFCRKLGIKAVKSPTYTVVNEYRGIKDVFHLDVYRLSGEDDLTSVGFDDYLDRPGVLLCEWSERIPDAIPTDAVRVTIEKTDDADGRKITVDGLPESVERSIGESER